VRVLVAVGRRDVGHERPVLVVGSGDEHRARARRRRFVDHVLNNGATFLCLGAKRLAEPAPDTTQTRARKAMALRRLTIRLWEHLQQQRHGEQHGNR
jgi:hypothetical protein